MSPSSFFKNTLKGMEAAYRKYAHTHEAQQS